MVAVHLRGRRDETRFPNFVQYSRTFSVPWMFVEQRVPGLLDDELHADDGRRGGTTTSHLCTSSLTTGERTDSTTRWKSARVRSRCERCPSSAVRDVVERRRPPSPRSSRSSRQMRADEAGAAGDEGLARHCARLTAVTLGPTQGRGFTTPMRIHERICKDGTEGSRLRSGLHLRPGVRQSRRPPET